MNAAAPARSLDARDRFELISDFTVRGKAALLAIGARPATALAVAPERQA